MLPNHSPMAIAEQFGTLATLHPGRIDLGLGRAPGSDRAPCVRFAATLRPPMLPAGPARNPRLSHGPGRIQASTAIAGKGTHVPLYILGSSLFGARLAAQLGFRMPSLPTSRLRPAGRHRNLSQDFQPSAQVVDLT